MNKKLKNRFFLVFCLLNFYLCASAMTGHRKEEICINSTHKNILEIWNISTNLKSDNKVSILILDDLFIDDNGAALIAEGLKENRCLKTLSMAAPSRDRNSLGYVIGPSGINALGEALKVNKTLTSLNLSGNNVGDEGAKILFQSLEDNRSLTELHLNNCSLNKQAAQEIINGLKKNLSLKEISLQAHAHNCTQNTIEWEESFCISSLLNRNKIIPKIMLLSLGSQDDKSVIFMLCNELRRNILLLVYLLF